MAVLVSLFLIGQVFKDASSFHGELKMLVRQIVAAEYDIFIPDGVSHNSIDALRYTVNQVEFYLEKGRFLRDENLDSEVVFFLPADLLLTHLNDTRGIQKMFSTKPSGP